MKIFDIGMYDGNRDLLSRLCGPAGSARISGVVADAGGGT